MTRLLSLGSAVLLLACGGAELHGQALPGAEPRVRQLERVYVEAREGDNRGIEEDIRDQLQAMGIEAHSGPGPAPEGYDAVVTYIDRYMWDMSMYCIQLTIYIRDAETGLIIGTGSSFRPSLIRKTPAGHAQLILQQILGEGA